MYTFGGYRLRKTTDQDADLLRRWVERDAAHRGLLDAEFFYKPQPGVETLVLLDADEEPVLVFRMMRALRLHIQFPPDTSAREQARVALGMKALFGFMEQQAPRAGFRQMIFDSVSARLRTFCTRHLRFHESKDEMVCNLPAVLNPAPSKTARPEQ